MAQNVAIIDKMLTKVSSMFLPDGFIADLIFPKIQVQQNTGKIAAYGNNHLRITNSVTAGEAKSRRVKTMVRSQSSYELEKHALHDILTEEDYENIEAPYDAEEDCALGLKLALEVGKEVSVAAALTSTAVLTQNVTLSGTGQFSDYSNSNPLGVFTDAHNAMRDGCGHFGNLAIMDAKVALKLGYHPAFLEALGYKYARPGGLTPEEIAKVMKVDRLLIANAMYDSSDEGQTSDLEPIWGLDIVMAYVPKQAARRQLSLGYHLTKSGEDPSRVYKVNIGDPVGAKKLLVQDRYDIFISTVGAGYLIKAAIAS